MLVKVPFLSKTVVQRHFTSQMLVLSILLLCIRSGALRACGQQHHQERPYHLLVALREISGPIRRCLQ